MHHADLVEEAVMKHFVYSRNAQVLMHHFLTIELKPDNPGIDFVIGIVLQNWDFVVESN